MSRPALFRTRWFAALLATAALVAVGGGLVYSYFFHPYVGLGPQQPIPFSHRVHVTAKEIDCRFCHFAVERSPNAGMPSAHKCLYCHKYIIPEHPYIRLVRSYAERDEAIPWVKVTWLPDHVYFSHQRHIRKGVQCVDCHGAVETVDRLREVNRLQMGFCVRCHRKEEASLDCWACHW